MLEGGERRFHEMADEVKAKIAALTAERTHAPDKAAKRELNQRIHMMRDVERFIRTRQGYADEQQPRS